MHPSTVIVVASQIVRLRLKDIPPTWTPVLSGPHRPAESHLFDAKLSRPNEIYQFHSNPDVLVLFSRSAVLCEREEDQLGFF
ncbi:hypothetical protein SprV_0802535900 [Sparganum proliferum]